MYASLLTFYHFGWSIASAKCIGTCQPSYAGTSHSTQCHSERYHPCHSERSEESLVGLVRILRCAQNDIRGMGTTAPLCLIPCALSVVVARALVRDGGFAGAQR